MSQLVRSVKNVWFRGSARHCPLCRKSFRKFLPYGIKKRDDAQCPNCGSLERQRFLWEFISRKTDLFTDKNKRMLHVAPEPCLEKQFRRMVGDGYLTGDLYNERAMVKMDITNIEYPDGHFESIYCSHVLEHVLEDRLAMREFCRVLDPKGWAILLVPIGNLEETYEDASIVSPEERLKHFGKEDHVRRYAKKDYVSRLVESGFTVEETTKASLFSPEEQTKFGLDKFGGDIFFCTKTA